MRKIFFRLLIVAMILPGLVQAQALPVSAMQRAISGIMQMKFVQRGFASNDPRWGATLATGGAAIGGAVAAAAVVTAAGVTAPAWVTVGATMALGALFTAGINLAVDGVKWLFNSDGSITTTANGTEPSQKGGDTYSVAGNIKGGDAVSTARGWADAYNAGLPAASQLTVFVEGCVDYASGAGSDCTYGYTQPPYGTTHNWHHEFVSKQAGVAYTCDGLTVNGVCNPPKSTAAAPVTMSPTAAAGSIGSGDGAKPVNPVVLAAIADQAWKQAAAQPGYTGLPYDASNPITQADAAAWQAANPAINPTVAQLVAPQPAPSGGTAASPFTLPNSAASPAVDPSTTPPVNTPSSGIDWSIPSTSDTIPKQSVSISYTPTVFAAPTGCPAPVSFSMFGTQYAIAYQPACDLMTTLAPIFLACGAAGAAIIFASALKP